MKNNKGNNAHHLDFDCDAAECCEGNGRKYATVCELGGVDPCADVHSLDIVH